MLARRSRSDSVRTAIAILLVLVTAMPASAMPLRRAAQQRDTICQAQFGQAIARGTATGVAASCWRIGPIQLGMPEAAVEQRIGQAVASADRRTDGSASGPPRAFHATLHAFSSTPGPPVRHGRAALRLAELLYEKGRLIAIDTAPGARIDGGACPGRPSRSGDVTPVDVAARGGPLLRFAGVTVGDPLDALGRAFGRSPSGNRSRDWYSYLPVPISVDVDPDRAAIVGFTIATDAQALTTSLLPILHLQRDAACRLITIQFALQP
jgi:hypothetical protein